MLALAFGGAALAVLIGASGHDPDARRGSVPRSRRAGGGCRSTSGRATVTRRSATSFARLAGYVSLAEAAGTIIYALDRIMLGLFKAAATVGLYEGPMRAHNVIRALKRRRR